VQFQADFPSIVEYPLFPLLLPRQLPALFQAEMTARGGGENINLSVRALSDPQQDEIPIENIGGRT